MENKKTVYDFDAPTERRHTGSLKWDIGDNELPMWVADMDFKTAPAITEAVMRRAAEGIFGYTVIPDEWYSSLIGWWGSRHGLEIQKEWLAFCTGVIPAISSAVKRITNVGDRVLVMTPVYDIFFHSIENAGRTVLECPLTYDGASYGIDFAALERGLAEPLTTMMILCNPHNPVGRIWSREELARIGELCRRHGVTVLSDEIHCDLTDPEVGYVPFASVSCECADNSVTCVAASKAFNLAGLQSAAVVIPNEFLRNKVVRGLNSDEVAEPNCFAAIAAATAFGSCGDWLDALRAYLAENKRTVSEFVSREIPGIHVVGQNATYLLWIDCSAITDDTDGLAEHIRRTTGLYLTAGGQYRGNGRYFLRMNTACQRKTLIDGLERLRAGVADYCRAKGDI